MTPDQIIIGGNWYYLSSEEEGAAADQLWRDVPDIEDGEVIGTIPECLTGPESKFGADQHNPYNALRAEIQWALTGFAKMIQLADRRAAEASDLALDQLRSKLTQN